MPPIIHRFSYGLIIFALIALVSGPAFGAVVYFGNISDWPQTPGKPIGSATSLSCSDIPEPVRTYLSNMGQYTGVPAAFLAGIAKTESGFVNPTTNLEIAWGIMQLSHSPYQVWQEQDALYRNDYEKNFANFKTGTTIQPPSQAKPRARTGNIAVDPFNEEYNVYIGSKYIWWLRGHYLPAAGNDDTKLFSYVAAAYNGGWPAFDNTKYTLSRMDKETIEYVPKVMTAYQDYKARCQKDLTPANPTSSGKSSLGVPLYQQSSSTCGTTSVNMVSDYLLTKNGKTATHQGAGGCATSTLGNMLNGNLAAAGLPKSYVQSPDGQSFTQTSYFQLVQSSLDKGFPVIEGVDGSHSSGGFNTSSHGGHFWVISGYNTSDNGTTTYTIADPATAQSYTETEDFLWQHSNNQSTGKYLIYSK